MNMNMNMNMNIKIKYLTKLILGTTIISCSPKAQMEREADSTTQAAYQVIIPEMKDSLDIHYSRIFSKMKYIHLESSTQESIIGTITRMVITGNKDIVILDGVNFKIVRYDCEGHFLNLIGERGHGPNEYVLPTAIDYDKYTNQILVWDDASKKILYYTLDGKIAKKVHLSNLWDFRVSGKNHWVYFYNYPRKGVKFNYTIADLKGKETSHFEPLVGTEAMDCRPAAENVFSRTEKDELLCRSYYSSIIYKVTENSVTPFIELTPPNKSWAIGKPEQLGSAFENRYNAEVRSTFVINNKVIVSGYHFTDKYSYLLCADLKGNRFAGKNEINDVYGFAKITCFITNLHDDIYAYISPNNYLELLKQWKDRTDIPQEDRDFAIKMSNSLNPIIFVCTVKD